MAIAIASELAESTPDGRVRRIAEEAIFKNQVIAASLCPSVPLWYIFRGSLLF
jgi:hypothetical protein